MSRTLADYRTLETEFAHFSAGPGGLVTLEIAGLAATARLFLQGAHLSEWTPSSSRPVLFVSRQSHFAPGKAIRGGVPVCFPWFAGRAGHPDSPAHGFLRTATWNLQSVQDEPDGGVSVVFSIGDSESTRAQWPHQFSARYSLSIGQSLRMEFAVENTGEAAFTFEAALHSYFQVSDVRKVAVTGLEDTEFIDKVERGARKRLGREPLSFSGETDRVFVNTTSTCDLRDQGFARVISVAKTGSSTTVVWNPWTAKAAALADFADDEWPGMLCIETANAGENAITLQPRETHAMAATISVRS